jgi:uncharacterized damage-inducible protein DinB
MHPADATAIREALDRERASLEDNATVLAYARIFFEDPVTTFEPVTMASNLLDDFDEYGPVIQADDDGAYSPGTSLERLRYARDRLFAAFDERVRPLWPLHCLHVAAYPRVRRALQSRSPSMSTQSLSERDGYVATFEREFQTTLRLLREYPADRLDLKPSERSFTAGQLMWGMVLGQVVIGRLLRQSEFRPHDLPTSPGTRDGIIAAFESSHAETLAQLQRATDADFDAVIRMPVGPRQEGDVRRGNALWTFLYDHIHHRGQLTVYQRMAGGKVPSIYGPSGDEPWG